MKTLFLECNMGAAGDMIMAALLELHDNPAGFIERLNLIGMHGVHVSASASSKCGIAGTHVTVTVNGNEEDGYEHNHHSHDEPHHNHNSMHNIKHIIDDLNVSEKIKKDALSVYSIIADAESHVHGVPVTEIHFHEVGNKDAVADIVGVCMLIDELAPELILSTPVHAGSGQVRCSHGILPVPAPATAHILKDIPFYSGNVRGELCTPTGAAILRHFVKKFDSMPVMTVSRIGYGMGKKDFENANCVRAFLGETNMTGMEVTELECNLDDMTPEMIAFAQQLLIDEGALDVYTIPIGMKKGRPGILFTCMCRSDLAEKMLSLIFKHTTTLGVRENISRRYILHRERHEVETQYGSVRIKTASGYGVTKSKPEYDDVAKIARNNNLSLADVIRELGR